MSVMKCCVLTERSIDCYELVKVKVKVTQEQATKAQKGSRGIGLLFL